MKQFLLTLYTIALLAGCKSNMIDEVISQSYFNQIDSLLTHKDFFNARDLFVQNETKLSEFHQLRVGAGIDNAFNELTSSNQKIELLLEKYSDQLSDSMKFQLLELKQANHGKLFEYGDAFKATDELLNKYDSLIGKDKLFDYRNIRQIWKFLAGQPHQQVLITDNTIIKLKRDKAMLPNLVVSNGSDSIDFIFDTGANLSTITESTSKQLGVIELGSGISVGSITGTKIESKIGICPQLIIGNITVKNTVFLIFPDSALALKRIDYQINGIIGFPVIEAMKEVQLTQNDEFIVPAKRSGDHIQNMALDFLTPVISLNGESYTFDTGAKSTILYFPFHMKYGEEIAKNKENKDLKFGGAGGDIIKKGYETTFKPTVEGRQLEIDSVMVLTESVTDREDFYYGNIGQDVIKKFKKMTLNFESMFIRFE